MGFLFQKRVEVVTCEVCVCVCVFNQTKCCISVLFCFFQKSGLGRWQKHFLVHVFIIEKEGDGEGKTFHGSCIFEKQHYLKYLPMSFFLCVCVCVFLDQT